MKSLLTLCFAAALGLFAAPDAAHAEGELTLRIATVAPPGTPWSELLKKFRKSVEKESEGKLKVKVYLGGSKGDEQSAVRQVYKGSIEAAGVSTGAVSTMVSAVDCLELPYLFDSPEEADKVLDAVRGDLDALLATKGLKLIMYSENGYRSFGGPKFFKTPDDLKAVKMRSQESSVHVETYRALGASPVPISVGEVQSSLQTNVVQGFDNTPLFTQAAGWNQAVTHFTVSDHIYQPALILVNKAWYDALPPELRTIIETQAAKLEGRGRKLVRALNPVLIDNLTKGDHPLQVYTHTAAEKEAFKKATRGVWTKRYEALKDDADGRKFFDAVMKAKGVAKP